MGIIAQDVQNYLRSLDGGWIDMEQTVDTFKSGTGQEPVSGILVAWMGYASLLKDAVRQDCNLVVVHEPIYYNHFDNDARFSVLDESESKKSFLEDSGLVVLRCHDLWDQYPGVGMRDCWSRTLGLENPVSVDGFTQLFEVSPVSAGSFASRIASSIRDLGQDTVQLVGPRDKSVRRIALGTGAVTPYLEMVKRYQPDLVVCTDDGFTYWMDGAYAIDSGVPAVIVNHAVSEVSGFAPLAEMLRDRFPDVPVHYIEQGCMFEQVAAE